MGVLFVYFALISEFQTDKKKCRIHIRTSDETEQQQKRHEQSYHN